MAEPKLNQHDGDGDKKPDPLTDEQQQIVDKRIASKLAKLERDNVLVLEAHKAQLAKEQEDRDMVERKAFKELAETREQELKILTARIEKRDLDAETDIILDAVKITDPRIRRMIKAMPVTLDERKLYIADLSESITEQVGVQVSAKLDLKAPDRSGGTNLSGKKLKEMTPKEKADYRKEVGDDAFVAKVRAENVTTA